MPCRKNLLLCVNFCWTRIIILTVVFVLSLLPMQIGTSVDLRVLLICIFVRSVEFGAVRKAVLSEKMSSTLAHPRTFSMVDPFPHPHTPSFLLVGICSDPFQSRHLSCRIHVEALVTIWISLLSVWRSRSWSGQMHCICMQRPLLLLCTNPNFISLPSLGSLLGSHLIPHMIVLDQ